MISKPCTLKFPCRVELSLDAQNRIIGAVLYENDGSAAARLEGEQIEAQGEAVASAAIEFAEPQGVRVVWAMVQKQWGSREPLPCLELFGEAEAPEEQGSALPPEWETWFVKDAR